MSSHISGLCRIATAAFLVVGAGLAQAEDNHTVSAFSTVESHGSLIPSAGTTYRMVGTTSGPFFIDGGHGPEDAGNLTCVGDIHGNTATGLLEGSGSCVITAGDGAQLFGDFTCKGVMFVGCKGDFVVSGGNGRMEGFTGGGVMTMRTSATEVTGSPAKSMAVSEGRGIVFWDDFDFTPPAESGN
jgi:hypothetical protein